MSPRVQAVADQGAEHHLGPDVQVGLGIGHDDRLAGGAAGGVQPHHLAHRAGEQAEGIRVAQIVLDRQRQPGDVVDAADVVGRHARVRPSAGDTGRTLS